MSVQIGSQTLQFFFKSGFVCMLSLCAQELQELSNFEHLHKFKYKWFFVLGSQMLVFVGPIGTVTNSKPS